MRLTKLNENKTLAEYEKEWEEKNGKTCDKCGTKLNDGGTCPKCDDGEEDSLKEGVSGANSEEFGSYVTAIERHKANGNEKELDRVITSAYNDLNRETRLTGPEFNKLCDLANLPNRKIEVREAYDPQEFNPDATGPIYDLNVQFYSSLEKAIEEERWEDAAKEYCEIKADLDKELQDADKKPIIGKLFKLFAKPHLRTLDAYKRRIPAEYLNDCDKKNENLTESTINKFYIDEIVPAQGGKTETERHSFDTIEELKQYVKDANLTEDDIATCGGCEIADLFVDEDIETKLNRWFTNEGFHLDDESSEDSSTLSDDEKKELYEYLRNMVASELQEALKEGASVDKLYTKPNGEYLVKADSGRGYTAFNRSNVAIGGIDIEDADSDEVAIHKFKCNEYSESLNKSNHSRQLDRSRHYGKDYDDEFTLMGY